MRRYRTVLLVLLFGVLPMLFILVLAITVILPSFTESQEEVLQVEASVDDLPPPEPEPAASTRGAVVADHLPAGTLLQDRHVSLQEVDASAVVFPQGNYVFLTEAQSSEDVDWTSASLRGFVLRRAKEPGELIQWRDVVAPYEADFLPTVLRPNSRAVSIPVSLATREARLVSPGNWVDVQVTLERKVEIQSTDGSGVRTEMERVVRTIVENVRVLAVNNDLIQRVGPRDSAAVPAEEGTGGGRANVGTVTLEVNPIQGERLVLAAQEGQLSVSIRPARSAVERGDTPLQSRHALLGEEEPPDLPPPEEDFMEGAEPVMIRVVRGTEEGFVVFEPYGSELLSPPDEESEPVQDTR